MYLLSKQINNLCYNILYGSDTMNEPLANKLKPNKLSDIIAKISIPKVYIISIETIDEINYLVKIKVEDNSYIDLVIKNVNKLRYVKDVKRV